MIGFCRPCRKPPFRALQPVTEIVTQESLNLCLENAKEIVYDTMDVQSSSVSPREEGCCPRMMGTRSTTAQCYDPAERQCHPILSRPCDPERKVETPSHAGRTRLPRRTRPHVYGGHRARKPKHFAGKCEKTLGGAWTVSVSLFRQNRREQGTGSWTPRGGRNSPRR